MNCSLSPVQQRNLEKEWNTKVIDRTGLILEIFGARAQTREGRLQVDLAAIEYQKSRLVRSWTHLERQRGGAGFMGGPGERQIELDRRMLSQRITKLKKELNTVRRTRDLGREARARVPFPIVSLVGYTNAGKSTLFNQLTDASVFAEDLPFATLDPTMRKVTLSNRQEVIMADTVGFIADLPTHLVASFRATLEQIVHADVILHVIDVSRNDYEEQKHDVIQILEELEIDYEQDARIIEVHNKIDLLDQESYEEFQRLSAISERSIIPLSALKQSGIELLLNTVQSVCSKGFFEIELNLALTEGKALSWLYQNAEILERNDREDKINLRIRISEKNKSRFDSQFQYLSN